MAVFFFLCLFFSPWKQQGRPDSPVYTNLQELKISQSSAPPLPSSSPLHTIGDWETHKDQNGRHFYYNRSTQERTWKPPRARDSLTRKEEKQETAEAEVYTQNILSGDDNIGTVLPVFISIPCFKCVHLCILYKTIGLQMEKRSPSITD